MNERPDQPTLFIGIDWADQKHDCHIIDRDGKGFHQEILHSPESIDIWVNEMLKLAKGKPIAIIRDFPFGIAWNHSRLGTLPIVTACAPSRV